MKDHLNWNSALHNFFIILSLCLNSDAVSSFENTTVYEDQELLLCNDLCQKFFLFLAVAAGFIQQYISLQCN